MFSQVTKWKGIVERYFASFYRFLCSFGEILHQKWQVKGNLNSSGKAVEWGETLCSGWAYWYIFVKFAHLGGNLCGILINIWFEVIRKNSLTKNWLTHLKYSSNTKVSKFPSVNFSLSASFSYFQSVLFTRTENFLCWKTLENFPFFEKLVPLV